MRMKLIKSFLNRKLKYLIMIAFVCISFVYAPSIRTQEAEREDIETIEINISEEVEPEVAITTKDVNIAIDNLKILVKPLTIEQLNNDATSWLFLLQKKAQEIANTEIAINNDARTIDSQKEVIDLIKEAEAELKEAEIQQKAATQGSPEYEKATQKIEAAKEKLTEAQKVLDEIKETIKENQEDETLQSVFGETDKNNLINDSEELISEIKEQRNYIDNKSDVYQALTQKINSLQDALNAFEKAKDEVESISAENAEEYEAAQKEEEAAFKALQKAFAIADGKQIEEVEGGQNKVEENINENLDETSAAIENAEENLDALTKTLENLEKSKKSQEELRNQLIETVTILQEERVAIIDRFKIVLNEIDKKGGDTTAYRTYIDAVSGIEIDVTDTQGLSVRFLAWAKSEEGGLRWGKNLGIFISIIIINIIIAYIVDNIVDKFLKKVNASQILRDFAKIIITRGGFVIGILIALSALEVSLAPILTILGGLSFILAFALQSNLGNIASGFMIIIYKPFDVGDEVKIGGYWAVIDSITLASTKLKDFGGNLISLPNNSVWGGDIVNLTHANVRKISFGIKTKLFQDVDQIQSLWKDITDAHPKVVDSPGAGIFPYQETWDYVMWIGLGAWTKKEDYWSTYVDLVKALQKSLQDLDIPLAIPGKEIFFYDHSKEMGYTSIDSTENPMLSSEATTIENTPVEATTTENTPVEDQNPEITN